MSEENPVFTLIHPFSLVLASTSPRRIQLLASLGLPFTTFSPEAEEPKPFPGENPGQFSLKCAILKNHACGVKNSVILSADTIVAIREQILGKPDDSKDALEMLRLLNGQTHAVYTSFCLRLPDDAERHSICRSDVSFAHWPDSVLKAYVHSGECLDKAGAYAIQGRGIFLVNRIDGSWTTVVGLPIAELVSELLNLGIISPL